MENTKLLDASTLYEQISKLIENKKLTVKKNINIELITMYWNIGHFLNQKVLKLNGGKYGLKTIKEVSNKLSLKYGPGFNRSSLFRMIQFSETFPDIEIVATLSQQLSWSHFIELISIRNDLEREFYIVMCMNEGWSIRTLRERKKSLLFERTVISKKPELTIKNELEKLKEKKEMSLDLFLRDPYILDFLDLKDTFNEKDLENAILNELEKFILEMGSDFAFLARQKHIIIGDKDYYLDLLFYHRTLNRLVLIELKLGEFEPSYKGQVELYLRWLNKYERNKGEESPIALILCSNKSEEVVELLDLNKNDIHVAQYYTKMPPKNLLEFKLKEAIAKAKQMLNKRG